MAHGRRTALKMCEESGSEDASSNGDFSQPRSSLRGPLILAKLVVDALEKKQQVGCSKVHRITVSFVCVSASN